MNLCFVYVCRAFALYTFSMVLGLVCIAIGSFVLLWFVEPNDHFIGIIVITLGLITMLRGLYLTSLSRADMDADADFESLGVRDSLSALVASDFSSDVDLSEPEGGGVEATRQVEDSVSTFQRNSSEKLHTHHSASAISSQSIDSSSNSNSSTNVASIKSHQSEALISSDSAGDGVVGDRFGSIVKLKGGGQMPVSAGVGRRDDMDSLVFSVDWLKSSISDSVSHPSHQQ